MGVCEGVWRGGGGGGGGGVTHDQDIPLGVPDLSGLTIYGQMN